MNRTLISACALGVGLLTACVSSPDIVGQSKPSGATASELRGNQSGRVVCVGYPADQSFKQDRYEGSGAEIGERVRLAVERAGQTAMSVRAGTDAIAECSRLGGTFLLRVEVDHYEDNYTGWSGKPDRIELRLRLALNSQPDRTRDISYEAKSNFLTSAALEWGNAKPVSLLRDDFDYLVLRMFRDL
ncbi:MAG: hypothetical protein RL434_1445 [Pseudomonadota bacterium]